jgi:hypothetical protein
MTREWTFAAAIVHEGNLMVFGGTYNKMFIKDSEFFDN